ncbi:helix-turn-helix domain-containing protein [Isoptericola sp. NPDC055881]
MKRELEALAAVAREGSMARAASTLHVAPSTVSRYVDSLERSVGHKLVRRAGSGPQARAHLTQQGRRALAYGCPVLCGIRSLGFSGPSGPEDPRCPAGEDLPCVGFGGCLGRGQVDSWVGLPSPVDQDEIDDDLWALGQLRAGATAVRGAEPALARSTPIWISRVHLDSALQLSDGSDVEELRHRTIRSAERWHADVLRRAAFVHRETPSVQVVLDGRLHPDDYATAEEFAAACAAVRPGIKRVVGFAGRVLTLQRGELSEMARARFVERHREAVRELAALEPEVAHAEQVLADLHASWLRADQRYDEVVLSTARAAAMRLGYSVPVMFETCDPGEGEFDEAREAVERAMLKQLPVIGTRQRAGEATGATVVSAWRAAGLAVSAAA